MHHLRRGQFLLGQFAGGEVRNVSVLVAIGVNEQGYGEVLAAAEGSKEDKASWTAFLRHLKQRGVTGDFL